MTTNSNTNAADDARRDRLLVAAHARIRALTTILRAEVFPLVVAAPKPQPLDGTIQGIFDRAIAWAMSLEKLGDVYDFQAQSAACRSLFEIVVDLVLLTEGAERVERLVAWEDLCRLAEARTTSADPGTHPAVKAAADAFISNPPPGIAQYWPGRDRPPNRWTNSRGLRADAARADALRPLELAHFARRHYARLNWAAHGSGLLLSRIFDESTMGSPAIRRRPGLC